MTIPKKIKNKSCKKDRHKIVRTKIRMILQTFFCTRIMFYSILYLNETIGVDHDEYSYSRKT